MFKNCILVISIFYCSGIFAQQNATYTETTKKYKTYPYSDPNPNLPDAKIYPYFRFDGFSDTGSVKEWKVVELENEYIKVQKARNRR